MPVAVGRDEDTVGVECVDVLDRVVLAELDACLHRAAGEPANEAGRLDRAVSRMRDRAVELPGCGARNVVEPLAVEAVLAQRLVLEQDRVAFLLVGGKAVAAGAAE